MACVFRSPKHTLPTAGGLRWLAPSTLALLLAAPAAADRPSGHPSTHPSTHPPAHPSAHPEALSEDLEKPTDGRPDVRLDRLDFPKDLLGAETFKKHLIKALAREAREVNWGAGRANRIEYRVRVTELRFTLDKDVLRVRCSAVGMLPGGQTAKSDLSFGGSAAERGAVVRKVLDIVARGVITRLAEMERKRRGLR